MSFSLNLKINEKHRTISLDGTRAILKNQAQGLCAPGANLAKDRVFTVLCLILNRLSDLKSEACEQHLLIANCPSRLRP